MGISMLNNDGLDQTRNGANQTRDALLNDTYENDQRAGSQATTKANGQSRSSKTKSTGTKVNEKPRKSSSRARKKLKNQEQYIITKSEKTVRALEDQFYGRSKEADPHVLKSLAQMESKRGSTRKQVAAEASLRLKQQHGIYKGYEIPKRKERRLPGASKGTQAGRQVDGQPSFAESLKNLLANQSTKETTAGARPQVKAGHPRTEDPAPFLPNQHLYLRHYRQSGPL